MRRDHGSRDQVARRLIAQSDAIHFTAHVYALMFRIIAAGGHSLNFPRIIAAGAGSYQISIRRAMIAVALLLWVDTAHAHGIAGNRYFAGTLTFDDPAVADEAILPGFATLKHPAQGGNVDDTRFNWSFDRLLTPTIAVTFDGGWVNRNWSTAQTSGLDTTNAGIKAEVFRKNRHEALISAGLAWGIGRSGAAGVDANGPNTIQPGVFFGKGFGDLPDQAAWLRPFAVTGAIVDEIPVGVTTGTALVPNLAPGMLQSIQVAKVETLHWGFSIQYSTYYLTSRFTGGPPKDEPLNQ
jgi:hypothetical protein